LNIYTVKFRWKLLLFVSAVIIGVGSLWYTSKLVGKLADEERKMGELWSEAQSKIPNEALSDDILALYIKVLQNNETRPVILVDKDDNIIRYRNLNPKRADNPRYLRRKLMKMKEQDHKIEIVLSENQKQYLYYSKSIILIKLTWYPYVQLGVILLFILVSYFAFSYSRKAEQNQVWLGLSKETAHQLGTPISSLLAWLEMMKLKSPDKEMLVELEKDIKRLEKITGRFSKIGSKPLLRKENIQKIITTAINYLKSRSSDRITFKLDMPSEVLNIPLNASLFEWVIENVCKNAIDAVNGGGEIELSITDHTQVIYIDITDSGKGISKSKFKTIFKPGYTTKERGWGLGLSLTKRIIEEYHDGKIFVYESEIGKGTVIRIVLKK
jgi:nitrogen-specific signal transduction histidine kinase